MIFSLLPMPLRKKVNTLLQKQSWKKLLPLVLTPLKSVTLKPFPETAFLPRQVRAHLLAEV